VADSNDQRDGEHYDFERLESLIENDPGAPEFPALAEAHRRAGRAEDARRISEEGLQQAPARLAGHVSLGLALLDLGEPVAARGELAGILDAVLEPHRTTVLAEPETVAEQADEPAALVADAPPDDDGVVLSDFQPASPAPVVTAEPLSEGLDDSEIDQAFDQAESQPDEMVSANRMAEQVLLDHAPVLEDESATGEGEQALTPVDADESEFAPTSSPIFHTQTMANLLEQQGDHEGAREIRDSLDDAESAFEPLEASDLLPDAIEGETPMDAAEVPEAPEEAASAAVSGGHRKGEILATLESWLHNLRRGAR
jgi:hypothetical protein